MASKAIHLKRGFQKEYITVEQLFEAAFGPASREYRHKSLLGWRPLAPAYTAPGSWAENKSPDGPDRTSAPPPGVKMYETDDLIVVEVELPAIDEDSLYLEISGDLLIIRGNRLRTKATKQPPAHKKAGRKLQRFIQLPVNARPGEVRARLEGNTIRVMIRKQNAK